MAFLLDTNVVSELRKGERAHPGVVAWYDARDDDELYLSVLVVGELRRGVESLRRRDARAGATLDHWLGAVVTGHADRILPVDREVAETWGRLNVPDPIPAIDGLLAATALVYGLTLVTRNTRDVVTTGADVFDPFLGR